LLSFALKQQSQLQPSASHVCEASFSFLGLADHFASLTSIPARTGRGRSAEMNQCEKPILE
jgi:hypothetical protein